MWTRISLREVRIDPVVAESANGFQELAKLNIVWESIPPRTDVGRMRQWVAAQFAATQTTSLCNSGDEDQTTVHIRNEEIRYGKGLSFKIRVYEPVHEQNAPRPALITYHGGGWIHGDATSDEQFAILFSRELNAVVLNVDYSLAPEHPFPRPLDDCYEALNWTIQNAEALNVNPSRIGLWGGSAGGNLAAAVALQDSSRFNPSRIRVVHLVVPATCLPEAFPEPLKTLYENGNQSTFLRDIGVLMGYYAPGEASRNPLVSILLSKPSAHHAPTHVTVAGLDPLRDQGIAYAIRLRDAGVNVQLECLPGVPHGFTWPSQSKCAQQWAQNQVRLLNLSLNTDF